MALFSCRPCSTSHNGLRCPNCGQPAPAVELLAFFIPMLLALSLVALAVPDEVVPRRAVEKDGSITYVFQSLNAAVLWPAGAVLSLLIGGIHGSVFKRKAPPPSPQGSPSGFWRVPLLAWNGARRFAYCACCLMLGLLFFNEVVVTPLTRFRVAEISDGSLVCHSLFRTREVPFRDVVEAKVERRNVRKWNGKFVNCRIAIRSRSRVVRSVDISFHPSYSDHPPYPDMIKMMAACVADVNNRR